MGLYWHFVDIVWIFLFPLLYLIDRHQRGRKRVSEHIVSPKIYFAIFAALMVLPPRRSGPRYANLGG